ncbi:hypothetical protein diail_8185 [Diaporthe ilicicola]|nr:hypothetical protein diail_8185 [Diaporthe ilicicola]
MYIPLPSRAPASTPPPTARAAPAPDAIPHVTTTTSSLSHHMPNAWAALWKRDATSSTNTTIGIVVGVLLGVFITASILFLYRYRYTVRFHRSRRRRRHRHHQHHSSKSSKTSRSSEGAAAPPPPPPPAPDPAPAADPPA